MLRLVRTAVLTLALVGLVATLPASAATWEVDTAHSSVKFQIRHLLTQVPGTFNDFGGTIVFDPENPEASSVEMTVQAASIDTNNEDRDNHLRSPDFFGVQEHPTLSFESTGVEVVSDSELRVTGELTMHGVTKTVTIPVQVLGTMGNKAGFSTEFKVDRKEYGINWNRMLDQGGALLGDQVSVAIDLEVDKVEMDEEEAAAR